MRFEHAAIVYNPASGRQRRAREEKVAQARRALERLIPKVEVRATRGPGDATGLAAEALAAGCDLICPCGGDGTINEVARGMADSEAAMLPLPAGTANVLAVEMGLPEHPRKAAESLERLTAVRVPLGRVRYCQPGPGERLFLLMCGIGVDASIVYNLDVKWKAYLGEGAYWLGSLDQLKRPFQPFRVRIGGWERECTLVVISKSRHYGGGLVITPHAHLLAGQFQVVTFEGDSPLRFVGYLAQIATGTLEVFPGATFHLTDRIETEAIGEAPIYIEVDGEMAGRIPARVDLTRQTVSLLVPPAYLEAERERRLARERIASP